MKKLVVLTGAGISAESGLGTFRDSDGLWEQYSVEEVATPEGWHRNPELVTDFYNARRKDCATAQPNKAHQVLAELEKDFEVIIVTQNIDDLHERAGSSKVIHLHGEAMKVCSSAAPNNPHYIRTLSPENLEVKHGEKAGDGSLLRPWIVWFGEAVPNIEVAIDYALKADLFVVIGTSLNVYPAASLSHYVSPNVPFFLIDPKVVSVPGGRKVEVIAERATNGITHLAELLKAYK